MFKLILSIILFLGLVSLAYANEEKLFDPSLHEVHKPLPADHLNPQAKPMLSCFYYPNFMIKQIDMGEKGAEQLSLISIKKGEKEPVCQRHNIKTEIVNTMWSGYFEGVKGDYIFYSGEDGINGGQPFAVATSDWNSIIFSDNANAIHSIDLALAPTEIDRKIWYDNALTIRYQRVYQAPCSLQSNNSACWNIVKQITGLTDEKALDCGVAYAAEEKKMTTPEQIESLKTDPSVIYYEVEVVLDGETVVRVTPLGKSEECHPAE